jgi:large subunit ribosomal protein L5
MLRLKKFYEDTVRAKLKEKFGYKNPMQIPQLKKIVVNIGVGDARENPRYLERAVDELTTITGQKAVITKARKSISNFKLREGMKIGTFVTLRGPRMWDFLDRFVTLALPRVRDFRGVSEQGFDGRGNYNLGLREQLIFPELPYDKVEKLRGMNLTICTTAKTDMEGFELLKELGMPFRRRSSEAAA